MIKLNKKTKLVKDMYRHVKTYDVRYTDVDFNDYLKLSSLLSMMEESACLSADELGFGYSVLQPKRIGFILVNWYVKLDHAVKLGDALEIHTWPVAPKKLIVMRDFELYVGGKKVGVATSRWCLVDLGNFSMLPAATVFDGSETYNDFRATEILNWKLPSAEGGEFVYSKVASYSDYDHYNHVNNTKYADFLLDAFGVDELCGKRFGEVRITYVKQTKCGEKLDVRRRKLTDGGWVVECLVGDDLHAAMQVVFYD